MPTLVNKSVPLDRNGVTIKYFFSPKHRGKPTMDISVWDIDLYAELGCFLNSLQNGWHNNDNAWGFISSDVNDLLILGQNLRNKELVIAKFIADQDQWHGYPADIRSKPKDKPLPPILLSWFTKGFISKPLMLRITKGQI